MSRPMKTIGLWVILIILFVAFYQVFSSNSDSFTQLSWTALETKIAEHQVQKLSVHGNEYVGQLSEGGQLFRAYGPLLDASTARKWAGDGVEVFVRESPGPSIWTTILTSWVPIIFLFLFFIFILRQISGKAPKLQSTLDIKPEPPAGTVATKGLDQVRGRIMQAAHAARNKMPGPRRILISGPPGTGKTTLIRAASVDTGLPLLAVAGSQFVDTFVGIGAARIRDLFAKAKAAQPVIVAIDDLDAFGGRRVAPNELGGRVEERHQTLVELMQWLDGLQKPIERMLFIATTSRPELLDEALLRPGRFELRILLAADGTATIEENTRAAAA